MVAQNQTASIEDTMSTSRNIPVDVGNIGGYLSSVRHITLCHAFMNECSFEKPLWKFSITRKYDSVNLVYGRMHWFKLKKL